MRALYKILFAVAFGAMVFAAQKVFNVDPLYFLVGYVGGISYDLYFKKKN